MRKRADKQLSSNQRRRVWIFTITLFLLCATLGSCSERENCVVGGSLLDDPDHGDPYCLAGTEVENPHFEIPGLEGTAPSYKYWIADGDKAAPAFDTYELHFQREGKMCDFLDNTPASPNGEDCLICDLCGDLNSRGCKVTDLRQPKSEIGPGVFEIVVDEGFMPSPLTRVIFDFAEHGDITKLRSACPNQRRVTFQPDAPGQYRFAGSAHAALRGRDGTGRIEIVNDANPSPKLFYQLTSHSEGVRLPDPCATPTPSPSPTPNMSCPGCVWFKLPAPLITEGFKEEGFSPSLRVTKLRVLKGTPSVDSTNGRYKLDDMTATPVHPSRVILFPAASDGDSVLSHDGTRCYANSSEDGDLNLTTCRRNYNVDCTSPNCVLPATPQYEHGPPVADIIWFVEFNPAEGGIVPMLNCGEVLAIEFTLERV